MLKITDTLIESDVTDHFARRNRHSDQWRLSLPLRCSYHPNTQELAVKVIEAFEETILVGATAPDDPRWAPIGERFTALSLPPFGFLVPLVLDGPDYEVEDMLEEHAWLLASIAGTVSGYTWFGDRGDLEKLASLPEGTDGHAKRNPDDPDDLWSWSIQIGTDTYTAYRSH